MKKILLILLVCIYSNNFYSQTYDNWRTSYSLSAGTENQDPDNDGYLNREEYAFGLNPKSSNASGKEFFNSQGSITVGSLETTDLSYQIYRSADYTSSNKYPDWEIFASRWGSDEWVGDYTVQEVNGNTIKISIPSAFSGQKFKLVILHVKQYPNFSFDHVKLHLPIRFGGATGYKSADKNFVAEHGFTSTIGSASIRNEIKAINPNLKTYGYVNSGIIHDIENYTNNLSLNQFALADGNGWAQNPRSGWYYFDYRKSVGYQRRADIVQDKIDNEDAEMIFFDALGKVGNATAFISSNTDKNKFVKKYYDFLFDTQKVQRELMMINYYFLNEDNALFRSWSTDTYTTAEGVLNNHFNAIYEERMQKLDDKDDLRERMNWYINSWTRHGKLMVFNGEGIDLGVSDDVFRASIFFTVMGRNTHFQGSHLSPGNGGWRHPEWVTNVTWRDLGEPVSEATLSGYVFSRDFEHMSVVCNVSSKKYLIKWFNPDGSVKTTWGTIANVPVTGLSVSPANASLSVGATRQLNPTVSPSNATTKGVVWSSSNTSVATVNREGIVTALKSGSATITGKTVDGNKTDTTVITVNGDPGDDVTGVSVTPATATLAIGNTRQLNAEVSPSNASNKTVSWESSNNTVASVNATSGLVTAKKAGSATITATTADGGFTDTSVITVTSDGGGGTNLALAGTASQSSTNKGGVPSRAIDGNTDGIWTGGSVTHTNKEANAWWEVSIDPANIGEIVIFNRTDDCCISRLSNFTVSVINGSNVNFTQTITNAPNPSITIDAGGARGRIVRIQLNGSGTTPLSLAEVEVYGSGSSTIPVTGVGVTPGSASITVGNTQQLSATVSPSDATDQTVSWKSNNNSVASVNQSGLVTAVSAGSATITATTTDGGFTDTSAITVTPIDDGGTNLALAGTASQSSTNYDGVPSRAIDGNTNGAWNGGSVTHTNTEANPWWEVNFTPANIGVIKIFNRTDGCCASRLSNFTVYVYNVNNLNFEQTFTNFSGSEVSIDAGGARGRTVRIQLNGSGNPLSLAEVEVYGSGSSAKAANEKALSIDNGEELSEPMISLYPNPAKQSLNFNINNANKADRIDVFSIIGQKVLSQKIESSTGTIDVSGFKAGIYILKTNGTYPMTTRFVKE